MSLFSNRLIANHQKLIMRYTLRNILQQIKGNTLNTLVSYQILHTYFLSTFLFFFPPVYILNLFYCRLLFQFALINCNGLFIFVRQIIKLLNVTCGFEDPAEAGILQTDGYIVLLNLNINDSDTTEEKAEWNDKTVNVSPTVDTAIALANIQVFLLFLDSSLTCCPFVIFNFVRISFVIITSDKNIIRLLLIMYFEFCLFFRWKV